MLAPHFLKLVYFIKEEINEAYQQNLFNRSYASL